MLAHHLKTLARHSAIYGSADVFGTFIHFLLLPILTRHLSSQEYGVLAILLLFGVMAKILFRMGLDSGFFRVYYELENEEDRKTFTTTILAAAGFASLFFFLVTAAAADFLVRVLLGEGYRIWILLVAADTFLNAFAFVPMNLFRIQSRSGYFTGATLFRNLLNAGLKVVLVVRGWGVEGVLWADVVSSGLFVLALSPVLAAHVGRKLSLPLLRQAASFGLPKVPHAIAHQVLNLADRKLLLWLTASRAEVGLYHVGYMFGTGVKFFLSAFELAWSPFVYSQVGQAGARETLARLATYAAAVLVAVGLAIAVLGRELLFLMTAPEYHAAAPVIPVVVLAYVLQGFFILTSIGIGISKRSYYYPVLTFSAAALNVALNLLLIPGFGKMGAAWATVAGYALMTGLGISFSRRHYAIAFEWGRIARILAAAGLSFLFASFAPAAFWASLLVKTAALAVFPLSLLLLGFFRAEEIARLKSLLGRSPAEATEAQPPLPGPR